MYCGPTLIHAYTTTNVLLSNDYCISVMSPLLPQTDMFIDEISPYTLCDTPKTCISQYVVHVVLGLAILITFICSGVIQQVDRITIILCMYYPYMNNEKQYNTLNSFKWP